MVALLHPHSAMPARSAPPAERGGLRLVVDDAYDAYDAPTTAAGPDRLGRSRAAHPSTRAHGPALAESSADRSADRSTLLTIVVVALVLFTGLLGVRVLQGSPPADGWAGRERTAVDQPATAPASPKVAPGDQLLVAKPGDSMWSIARTISPQSDPRPVVTALIEANGGDTVQIGQQIVIPVKLLD